MGKPKWNSKIVTILMGTFCTRTALFMSMPYLAVFLTGQKQFSVELTGYVLGINPLVNVLFSGLGGALADKLSAKAVLRWVPIFWGIFFSFFYAADTFWQFMLLNGLNGLCYSLFEPASKKALSLETAQEDRITVYNLRYAAINLGAFAGPMLSVLFNMKTTMFPYVILGAVYILYGISTAFIFRDMKESVPAENHVSLLQGFSVIRKDSVYLLLLIGMSFSFFGYAQFNATVSQYVSSASVFTGGIHLYSMLLSMNAVIVLAAQFFVVKRISTWNPFSVILLSNLLIGGSLLLLGLVATFPLLLVFIVLFSLGELLIGARFDTLIDELSAPETKGMYFGLSETVKTGSILGPIIGTFLLGRFGVEAGGLVFTLLCGITLAGSVFIGLAKSRYRASARTNACVSVHHRKKTA
ncbi:MFS transporter [Gorillibacterium massiliense]|uniref:MFS transporter n=1 Tax=Gorillibacterium massiliense TaxID=1280390 RepID=UPI0004AE9BE4|nr:MFS transporter [Gorillibacterium massiliense]